MKCLNCNENPGKIDWWLNSYDFKFFGVEAQGYFPVDEAFCSECYDNLSEEYLTKVLFNFWEQQAVTKPSYYTWHPLVECQVVSREFMSNLGQAIQYIWRSNVLKPTKGATKEAVIEDLEKAIRFIEFEIERIKAEC